MHRRPVSIENGAIHKPVWRDPVRVRQTQYRQAYFVDCAIDAINCWPFVIRADLEVIEGFKSCHEKRSSFVRVTFVSTVRTMIEMDGRAGPGDIIGGRYRVESWLGQGNMAVVYRAVHLGTKQPCALKIMHTHLVTSADVREMFIRETQVGARIGANPHIVNVFDAGIDLIFDVPYLTMELLEGITLDRYIKRHGPMPPGLVRTLFLQLGDALEQAHGAGVVHRDLKPGNFFLTYDRRKSPILKIVDFGIAKVLEHQSQAAATQIGSPAYAAPEQLAGPTVATINELAVNISATISPATDIWALGLVAYELLVGVAPGHLWTGGNRLSLPELVMRVVVRPTPLPEEQAGDRAHLLPRGFDQWLNRCLHKDPLERWPTAMEAARELADLLDTGFDDIGTAQMNPRMLDDIAKKVAARIGSSRPPPGSAANIDAKVQAPSRPSLVTPTGNVDFDEMAVESEQPTNQVQRAADADDWQAPRISQLSLSVTPASVPKTRESQPGPSRRCLPPPDMDDAESSAPDDHLETDISPPATRTSRSRSSPPHEASGVTELQELTPQPSSGGTDRGIYATKRLPSYGGTNRWTIVAVALSSVFAIVILIVFPRPPKSRLRIASNSSTPGMQFVAADVFLNDRRICTSLSCTVNDIDPGTYEILVVPRDGAQPFREKLTLLPGLEAVVNVSFAPTIATAPSASIAPTATANTSTMTTASVAPIVSVIHSAPSASPRIFPRLASSLYSPTLKKTPVNWPPAPAPSPSGKLDTVDPWHRAAPPNKSTTTVKESPF